MFNILPLIIILACLGVIITIVVRKLSVLANLNVDSIPEARESRIKEQILSNRLKRGFQKLHKRVGKVAAPAANGVASLGRSAYGKLIEYKEKRRQEEELAQGREEDVVEKRFHDIDEFMQAGNWVEAEKKCIEVIGLDPVNVRAFQLLGKVYEEKKEYPEAVQTLEHVLRLLEKDIDAGKTTLSDGESRIDGKISQICFDLSRISRLSGNNEAALTYIERSLRAEPNSPKLLDIKLQISIIIKDKAKALEALEKLKEVNPDNQKIAEFEEQVRQL